MCIGTRWGRGVRAGENGLTVQYDSLLDSTTMMRESMQLDGYLCTIILFVRLVELMEAKSPGEVEMRMCSKDGAGARFESCSSPTPAVCGSHSQKLVVEVIPWIDVQEGEA